MRTVESYRGLQVHVFEATEEVPSWVRAEIADGRAVMARGEFTSTAALAHILDRYIDEVLSPGADSANRGGAPGQRGQRPGGGRR